MQLFEPSDTPQSVAKPPSNGSASAENLDARKAADSVFAPEQGVEPPPDALRREPNVFASAVWLMQLSPRHRHLFLADLEWALMPPLALKQFRLFQRDGIPVALVTWASVSNEVEARLAQGQMRLKPDEWQSGEHCWLIDLLAPAGSEEGVIRSLVRDALADKSVRYLGRDAKTGKTRVIEARKDDDDSSTEDPNL